MTLRTKNRMPLIGCGHADIMVFLVVRQSRFFTPFTAHVVFYDHGRTKDCFAIGMSGITLGCYALRKVSYSLTTLADYITIGVLAQWRNDNGATIRAKQASEFLTLPDHFGILCMFK